MAKKGGVRMRGEESTKRKRRAPEGELRIDVRPENYGRELQEKVDWLKGLFQPDEAPEPEVFESPREGGFRMRAEFAVKRDGAHNELHYVMFRGKEPVRVDRYPMGSKRMQELMPRALEEAKSDEEIGEKLFQVNFLTTLSGDALVVFLYHKPLSESWQAKAKGIEDRLGACVMGRARKQRITVSRDYVVERLQIDGREVVLKQPEGQFSQPNALVASKMASWACDVAGDCGEQGLLELYCGNGHFTVPLSRRFCHALATEVCSRPSLCLFGGGERMTRREES